MEFVRHIRMCDAQGNKRTSARLVYDGGKIKFSVKTQVEYGKIRVFFLYGGRVCVFDTFSETEALSLSITPDIPFETKITVAITGENNEILLFGTESPGGASCAGLQAYINTQMVKEDEKPQTVQGETTLPSGEILLQNVREQESGETAQAVSEEIEEKEAEEVSETTEEVVEASPTDMVLPAAAPNEAEYINAGEIQDDDMVLAENSDHQKEAEISDLDEIAGVTEPEALIYEPEPCDEPDEKRCDKSKIDVSAPVYPNLKDAYGQWSWQRVDHSARMDGWYLLGESFSDGRKKASAVAVRSRYSPVLPEALVGFCGYVDGFYIIIEDALTKKRLPLP